MKLIVEMDNKTRELLCVAIADKEDKLRKEIKKAKDEGQDSVYVPLQNKLDNLHKVLNQLWM